MIQEVITYMIIGSAVTVAVMKMYKKFSKKKIKKTVDFKNQTFTVQHNCSDCSAECMLRDAIQKNPVAKNQTDLCGRVNVKSN